MMNGRRILLGMAMAVLLALGATGAARADWDDHPMGPGMMGPGMGPYPGCDWDDHGMGPGMPGRGMGPYPGQHSGCDWDGDWWDD